MDSRRKCRLRIVEDACNGCSSCQIYCATEHEGMGGSACARIQIHLDPFEGRHRVCLCRQCRQAACAEICPEGAIYLCSEDSCFYWAIDYSRCTDCQMCVEACPFDALFYDPVRKRVIKCDLCKGDPLCARICPTGTLTWERS
jgi:Fe-S-cluster-containing hydrogenase component 2